MDNKKIEDWLEKYFNDELTETEKVEFQKLLSENEELKSSFMIEKEIVAGIKASKKKETAELIRKEHKHYINSNTQNIKIMKNRKFPLVGIVAALAILVAAFFVFKPSATSTESNPYDNSKYLAAVEVFQKKNLAKYTSRGPGDEVTFIDTLNQGLDLSLKGKYAESKKLFLRASEIYPDNEFLQFQMALQDFYIGNYAEIFPRLSKIVNSNDADIREESEMLYAQAAFRLEDKMTTAKKWLNKIVTQSNHRYYQEAQGMLSLL